jgi:polynucleotide 5'-hydroxyl-kinase GRC3/NOL9
MMPGWQHAVEEVLGDPGAVVMLGSGDVGKTTAATALANTAVQAGQRTAVVDADTGQSDLGPPATVGLGILRHPVRRMGDIPLLAACFVGDTSPRGIYRYLVEGTSQLVGRARNEGAQLIIVDTTGWIEGATAVAAKIRKIRRIDPRHLVAIQRAGEVEPILSGLPGTIAVHRLRPSPLVRSRSPEERRSFRERSFARYFRDAKQFSLDLTVLRDDRYIRYAGKRIPHGRVLAEIPAHLLRHLLVGLLDGEGVLSAVATIVDVSRASHRVDVVAPLSSLAGVRALQWGALLVAPSGREEGRLPGAA